MLLDDSLLTTLHISDIDPHPDNPRKDLGDLEELTESIQKNGIMQNLTVVPVDEDNPVKYICLIGHRRLAAAKAAGIYQVPARIVFGLSHKDQVGIMLEENMQRNDLTIVEQAQGFQMMLDLGETEETIAEKTGFSRTTVHHRLQLAKLDQKELKRRQDDESFQLSLKDLYALEKVKDINKRNEILKGAYSSNEIRRQAENAERDEQREKKAAVILKQIPEAKPLPKSETNWRWSGKWDTLVEINLDNPEKEIVLDLEDGEVPRYGIGYGSLYIVVPARKTQKDEERDEKRKDIDRRRKEMSKLQKQFEEDRRQFVVGIIEGKYKKPDDLDRISRMLWAIALEKYATINWRGHYEFLTGQNAYALINDNEEEKAIDTLRNKSPEDLILITTTRAYEGFVLMEYSAKAMPETMKKLKEFYNVLELYGYQLSEDERKVLAGTHELYIREES